MIKVPAHLSYSALAKFLECGERFRLEKHYLSNSDWFASAGGGAVHTITEHYDLGDLPRAEAVDRRVFADVFDKELTEREGHGKTLKPSGKVTLEMGWSGGPNKRDAQWWYTYGPKILAAYIEWRDKNPWSLATIGNGKPAVELAFEITIAGVQVIGYIDRIFYDPYTQQYIIVDIKTGAAPKSELQLGTYQVGLREQFGWDVSLGGYLSPFPRKEYREVIGPRGGRSKELVSEEIHMGIPDIKWLSYDQGQLEKLFSDARNLIEAGIFLPNPGAACNACPVIDYCWVKQGVHANSIPVKEDVVIRRPQADELRGDDEREEEDDES